MVRLPQPYLIQPYNQTMGGEDIIDKSVEKYHISIIPKKWWWPVFMYCIDLAVQQIYRATEAGRRQPLDLLGVRRATVLLAQGCTPVVSPGIPRGRMRPLSKRIPDPRLDGINHYAEPSRKEHCSLCGQKSGTKCSKCNIGVQRRCVEVFHSV
ncbi:piggyBac transposable element-derived protein 2-like [Mercenaria mercenaria]|uniref:piggyBac transposable element-derived protein 2-like n=1 Tax=Mercenaria mercenaria TaxID=6596 RepID=UPI00234E418C|nr:piggyBac transposable element-derived protein 2-like [Mercenaria mercenaria]